MNCPGPASTCPRPLHDACRPRTTIPRPNCSWVWRGKDRFVSASIASTPAIGNGEYEMRSTGRIARVMGLLQSLLGRRRPHFVDPPDEQPHTQRDLECRHRSPDCLGRGTGEETDELERQCDDE